MNKYAPVFVLDRVEPYWPSTVGDYVKNCRVIKLDPDGTRRVLLENVNNPSQIMAHDGWNNARLDLKTDDDGRREGTLNKKYYPSKLEVYFYERVLRYEAPDASDGNTATDLAYSLWFPYNGTSKSHISDREFVVVRLRNNVPVAMYFSNHQTGYWVPWSKVELSPEGQPMVYVSRESHALYHKSGTNWRALGFGNDVHKPGGQTLAPNKSYSLVDFTKQPPQKPWVTWTGGRAADDARPMLVDGTLWYPEKGCPVTDFSAIASGMLSRGAKIGIIVGLVAVLVLTVGLGLFLRRKRAWLVALGVPPAVALGLMWVVATSNVTAATVSSFSP